MRGTALPLLLAALGAAALLAACRSTPGTQDGPQLEEHGAITTERLEPYSCGTIQKLHTYGGVFLASQPSPADFEQARKGGVKTVINMRHPGEIEDFDERAVVEGVGLTYVNEPWNGPAELTDRVFERYRQLLNTAERPILLHCSSANRVGAVWIPWRVLDGGVALEAAVSEARTIGLKSPDYEAKARDYVRRASS